MLNSERFHGFQSEEGVPLAPVDVKIFDALIATMVSKHFGLLTLFMLLALSAGLGGYTM